MRRRRKGRKKKKIQPDFLLRKNILLNLRKGEPNVFRANMLGLHTGKKSF